MSAALGPKLEQWITASQLGEKPLLGIVVAMLVSTAASAAAQLLYALFCERRATGSQIQRSFLLIGPSVTLLFICVQLSLPLSLGLLGALSIVRFRVPVKEPEEVGFLMVVIAASIACATYSYHLLAILLLLVAGVLALREALSGRAGRGGGTGGALLLTLSDEAYARHAAEIERLLRESLGRVRLESLASRDGRTDLNYAFRGRPGIEWSGVKRKLAETCGPEAVSVLFNRQP
jgi:hypothetical protein